MYNPSSFPMPFPFPTPSLPLPPYIPGGGGGGGGGPIAQKARSLIGRPAGISLRNGQGVSGVICRVQGGEVYVLQYLYQRQFATFHYRFNQIQDINPFPNCQPSGPYY